MDDAQLTDTERRVVAAAANGEELDLRTGDLEQDDPAKCVAWPAKRTVRAEVLYELCVDTTAWPVHNRGVRVRGARIAGALDLEAGTVACPVVLRDCCFSQPVTLAEAQVPVLRLSGSHLPSLDACQLRTRGDVDLSSAHVSGEVRLLGGHIGGQLAFNGATLTNPDGHALVADGLTVDGDMFCHQGFSAAGEVRLLGAHIGGQLNFSGATLTNPNGMALNGEHLTVGQAMFLRLAAPPAGELDLTQARVGGYYDAKETWPKKGKLLVDGFTYDAIQHADVSAEDRKRWLQLTPEYGPRPYEQLIAVYRRGGHEHDARRIAIAKQVARRQRGQLSGPAKAWSLFLGATVRASRGERCLG